MTRENYIGENRLNFFLNLNDQLNFFHTRAWQASQSQNYLEVEDILKLLEAEQVNFDGYARQIRYYLRSEEKVFERVALHSHSLSLESEIENIKFTVDEWIVKSQIKYSLKKNATQEQILVELRQIYASLTEIRNSLKNGKNRRGKIIKELKSHIRNLKSKYITQVKNTEAQQFGQEQINHTGRRNKPSKKGLFG